MRKNIFLLLLVTLISFVTSCSKETDLDDQKHSVEYKIWTDDPNATVCMVSYFGAPLYFKGSFEGQFVTDEYQLSFDARCDDPYVLMTLEIYVDGKLKQKLYRNHSLHTVIRIKGKGLD